MFSSFFALIRFYLFAGGILCVCAFFCSFFWGGGSKGFWLWFVLFFLVGGVLTENGKFLGGGGLEGSFI